MAAVAATPARFDMGRVVSRTFGAVGRNFIVFFALGFVLLGGPAIMMALGFDATGAMRQSVAVAPPNPLAAFMPFTPLYWSGLALYFIGSLVLQAALIHGAVMHFNGRSTSLGDCLAIGLRFFPPVLAIGILTWLALALIYVLCLLLIAFGVAALVAAGASTAPFIVMIPAVIFVFAAILFVMTGWAVVVPAEVVERAGVFGAFSRSWVLTRKNRWAIFFLGLAAVILLFMFNLLATALGGAISASGLPSNWSAAIATSVVLPFSAIIGATGAASVYFELRSVKEGLGADQLAAVFD